MRSAEPRATPPLERANTVSLASLATPELLTLSEHKLRRGSTDSRLISRDERIERLREGVRTMFREHVPEAETCKPSLWKNLPARLRPAGRIATSLRRGIKGSGLY